MIRSFVERTDLDVKEKFETLLAGGSIRTEVTDQLTYDQLYASEKNLWSLLLMTGYVTKAAAEEPEGELVELRIPNREITDVFEQTVAAWFQETLAKSVQRELLDALWTDNAGRAGELISRLLVRTISYHNYREDYYQAFLAGLFTASGYGVKSDRETGLGRSDIEIRDLREPRVILIEAKKAQSKADMAGTCASAAEQIQSREYYREFLEDDYEVLCYGVAFWKKQAMVQRLDFPCESDGDTERR